MGEKVFLSFDAPEAVVAVANLGKGGVDRVRADADALEMLVDDELWPMPKYRELLFF